VYVGQLIFRYAGKPPRRNVRGRAGSGARALFLVLALAALSMLALRPICDVLVAGPGNARGAAFVAQDADGHTHAAHGSDGSAACCTSIGGGAPLAPLVLGPATGGSGAQLAFFAAVFFLVGTGFLPFGALRFAGAPPKTRPYHARSARILR